MALRLTIFVLVTVLIAGIIHGPEAGVAVIVGIGTVLAGCIAALILGMAVLVIIMYILGNDCEKDKALIKARKELGIDD